MATEIKCLKCGKSNQSTFKFCVQCGAPLETEADGRIKKWTPREGLENREWWLYWSTFLLEVPGAGIRFGCLYILLPLILLPIWLPIVLLIALAAPQQSTLFGDPGALRAVQTIGNVFSFFTSWVSLLIVAALAFGNMVVSLITVNGGITKWHGNFLTRFATGARDPSQREREAVLTALEQIQERSPVKITSFQSWYVIDSPTPNAYVVGHTLYVTRSLIQDNAGEWLAPVLAHELGHLNGPDGRITLALRRLILPHTYLLNQISGDQVAPGMIIITTGGSNQTAFLLGVSVFFLAIALALAGGGLGLFLLNPLWVWHWRDREYYADNFAAQCGFAQELIDYLERHQFFDTATPFFMSPHPYTELRIDKLLAYQERQQGAPVASADELAS